MAKQTKKAKNEVEKKSIAKVISLPYAPTRSDPLDQVPLLTPYTVDETKALVITAHLIKGLTFPEAIYLLYSNSGLTQEEFAKRSALNVSTVQAYIDPECKKDVRRATVISMCIGLQLPPIISTPLLHAAGYCFTHRPYDQLLESVLLQQYMVKIDIINEQLISAGYPPLSKERKSENISPKTKKQRKTKNHNTTPRL